MRARQITGNLFKLAILCACIFAFTKWQAAESEDRGFREFAENACIDEIGGRYNVSGTRVYNVIETGDGYSVRASATSARGTPVKIVCLANSHGGVRDIVIDER